MNKQEEKKMHLVASCNTQFVPHLAALWVSILDNCEDREYTFDFYIVDDSIEDDCKETLRETLENFENFGSLTFLTIDKAIFKNVVTSDRIPATAYFRIEIPELFRDKNVEKVLYMDCDMIALTDITKLWETDLQDHILTAVEDAGFHQRLEKMGIKTKSNRYFNSGLMLINVKKWLEENVTERVFQFIEENPEKLRFHDQDALNAILHDCWVPLHSRWNAQSYILKREIVNPRKKGEEEYEETRQQPAIIHFTGHIKPWNKKKKNVTAGKLYIKYSRMTEFEK